MTDRDTFAAAALTGLLVHANDGIDEETLDTPSDIAYTAYQMADAMLRERQRTAQKMAESDTLRAVSPNHDAAPAARASVESVAPQPTTHAERNRTDKAAIRPGEGTGETLSKADYGRLRSLLVRLRPEWEGDSDRSKPISEERLAALEELSAFDQELEAKHGLQGNPMIKARRNNESI